MKAEHREKVMGIVKSSLKLLLDVENKMGEITNKVKQEMEKEFLNEPDEEYVPGTWNVATGKNFSVSTDGKKGWYAHIYLKAGVSILIWRAG